MFGSAYVAGTIYTTAKGLTAVTNVVADRIERRFYPQESGGFVTPFLVYRMSEPAMDDAPFGRNVSSQTIRFEIAMYDDGPNVTGIIAAMEALHDALHGLSVTVPGKGWQITCRREQEIPDLDIDFGLPFVRVGGIYVFDVG